MSVLIWVAAVVLFAIAIVLTLALSLAMRDRRWENR